MTCGTVWTRQLIDTLHRYIFVEITTRGNSAITWCALWRGTYHTPQKQRWGRDRVKYLCVILMQNVRHCATHRMHINKIIHVEYVGTKHRKNCANWRKKWCCQRPRGRFWSKWIFCDLNVLLYVTGSCAFTDAWWFLPPCQSVGESRFWA